MYGWIVDGLSSLFVPFSGGKSAAWPSERGNGEARAAGTDTERQDNSRPAKRNYQSVYSTDGATEYPETKRARHDVIVRVVKKTFAGIAGLFRLRRHRNAEHEKQKAYTPVGRVAFMGIDDIHSNSLNTWLESSRMDKQIEIGVKSKERTAPNVHHNPHALRKPDGVMMYKGSQDRAKDPPQRRSLMLVPSCTAQGLRARPAEMETPSSTHKPCLTVEEALRESDREHYRKLVKMASEKYSKSKPLPFGRTKPLITTFPLDGHKATSLSRTTEMGRPASVRAISSMSLWRDPISLMQTKERMMDVNRSTPGSDVKEKGLDGQTARQIPVDVDLSAEVEARLNLREKDTAAGHQPLLPSRPELITDTVRRSEEFPRLTKEMQQEVSAALAQSDPNLVLCSAFKLRITQRDLATLQEGSWLNDEVINFYMNLVMSRSEQEVGGRKVYSFSTFLFPKLHSGGHTAVRRWTKAVDLFQYDIILVPLHLGVHWSLAVVDFKSKSVRSYDSMGQRHDDICNMILLYLKEEFKVKKGKDLDILKWTVSSLRPTEIPQQKNGSDCGVFVCKYADYITRGCNLTFRQNHMPFFRKAMIWEILNQKLLQ
ncbi:sentrin-specific protease 2-like isoform X1 [Myxocyprinus asiaticus]|uniref:sentrin-specific protease 2-like isoform X1 n=2 Tax=Myxocyprinus asiaticus TaxID=70543 RepID=UPI0022227B44|nr:sentrin-specific protease 2-like isoform X1 [Myxocyprinus asiaticus]